ncbi:MAG: hypothetical protein ND866_24630 [Pyrinomonadaceae bacterium]|nr:hypothetical protein [Pyrinomonadaceae bacterium]
MELHHRLGQATPGLTAQLAAESFTSNTIKLQTKLADRIGKLEETHSEE